MVLNWLLLYYNRNPSIVYLGLVCHLTFTFYPFCLFSCTDKPLFHLRIYVCIKHCTLMSWSACEPFWWKRGAKTVFVFLSMSVCVCVCPNASLRGVWGTDKRHWIFKEPLCETPLISVLLLASTSSVARLILIPL